MSRSYSQCDPMQLAAALRAERDQQSGRLWTLLDDAAGTIARINQARLADAVERQTLLDRISALGGGVDRRGLDGDPREPDPGPQELKQGTWVDLGSHA
jgi:hypothetical protein